MVLKASDRGFWGLWPWGFSGGPRLRLGRPDFVYGLLQPLGWISVLFDSIDIRQRRLHEKRFVSKHRTFGIDLPKAGAQPFDNVMTISLSFSIDSLFIR